MSKYYSIAVSFYVNKTYKLKAKSLEEAIEEVSKMQNLEDGIWWTIGKDNNENEVIVRTENMSSEPLMVYEEFSEEISKDQYDDEKDYIIMNYYSN